jgi:hypothetical protein
MLDQAQHGLRTLIIKDPRTEPSFPWRYWADIPPAYLAMPLHSAGSDDSQKKGFQSLLVRQPCTTQSSLVGDLVAVECCSVLQDELAETEQQAQGLKRFGLTCARQNG